MNEDKTEEIKLISNVGHKSVTFHLPTGTDSTSKCSTERNFMLCNGERNGIEFRRALKILISAKCRLTSIPFGILVKCGVLKLATKMKAKKQHIFFIRRSAVSTQHYGYVIRMASVDDDEKKKEESKHARAFRLCFVVLPSCCCFVLARPLACSLQFHRAVRPQSIHTVCCSYLFARCARVR